MSLWELQPPRATLRTSKFTASLDLAQPSAGWLSVQAAGRAIAGKFLGLRHPRGLFGEQERLTDSYVRGTDLIATYEERPERPLRPQVYWRALQGSEVAGGQGLEVIVSMQTHLLDSDPGIVCETELASEQMLVLSVGGSRFEIAPAQGANPRPL